MRRSVAIVVAGLMAAVSVAEYSSSPHEETTDKISKYDDLCYHCIDAGNLFCSADGLTGKCYAASCIQDEFEGEAKKAAKGRCTLRKHACDDREPSTLIAMTAYSQCKQKEAQDLEKCPASIEITGKVIQSGGQTYTDENTGKDKKKPLTQDYTIPANSVCITDISVPEVLVSFPETINEKTKGGFYATEWEEDVYVMMTKLVGDEAYDTSNSAMYSSETYYYNNRENDKGDFAGRVPVEKGNTWRVLLLNYNDEDEQKIQIVYGGAFQSMLTYTGLAMSFLFTSLAF